MQDYLLKGSISGIQDFIFSVSSKGAAKSLKAKSYLIQVIGYLAAEYTEQKLPNSKLFYEGGGSFIIEFKADNDTTAHKMVSEIQKTINNQLLHDDFAINIVHVSLDRKNFGRCWESLRKETNKGKLKSYSKSFAFFEPFDKRKAEQRDNDTRVSTDIKLSLEEIGLELTGENDLYKQITDEFVKRASIIYTLFDSAFIRKGDDFDGRLINKLPFWKHYKEINEYKNYRNKHQADYHDNFDLKVENLIDFDAFGDFAAHRTGTNKIGILKLDIDNLGQLFGTQADEGSAKNLSDKFKRFFDERLYEIYKHSSFSLSGISECYEANLYPIFAGGDDCFIIGAWDAVICFANDLHKAFIPFVEDIKFNGAAITLSAGIAILDPTHPVKSFSESIEASLYKAKSKAGKNAICVFGLVFSWDEYEHILNVSGQLRRLMEEKNINRSYLDKLRKSAKGFNALQNADGVDFNKIYKLKYYISRQDSKLDELVQLLFEPYYKLLKSKLLDIEKIAKLDVAIYPAIARITELLTNQNYNMAQPSYNSSKIEIWKFFYDENDKKKPNNEASFITAIKSDKDYLLTDGMEKFIRNKICKTPLTKTQMRTLFEEIKNTKAENIAKLQVKLIYIAGKIDNKEIKDFIQLLIKIVKADRELSSDFIESALAYHKFYAIKN